MSELLTSQCWKCIDKYLACKKLQPLMNKRILFYFCSKDEFLKFLQKWNKECSKLTVSLQAINNHFLRNSHKVFNQRKKG